MLPFRMPIFLQPPRITVYNAGYLSDIFAILVIFVIAVAHKNSLHGKGVYRFFLPAVCIGRNDRRDIMLADTLICYREQMEILCINI